MAYLEPGVVVSQEFVNALPALAAFALPNVNVGPAFQVVAAKSAGSYAAIAADYIYPEQILGTIVDTRAADAGDLTSYPVKIDLKNVVIRIINQTGTGAVDAYDLNKFNDATLNIFQNVVAGDVIVVTGSVMGNNGPYTIREKVSSNVVITNETFTAVESGLNYSIRRNIQATIGNVNIPTSTSGVTVDDVQVHLPAALTYTDTVFGTVPILSADVLLSYRALRLEKSADVFEYKKTSELQADFGLDQIVPENPVVFACFLALNNSATPTNLLALPQDFLTPGDELLAYSKAFDVLALTEMYAISVMTQNTAVHGSLKSHVETMSQPNNKRERVGIINRKIVLKANVVDAITTSGAEGISGVAFNILDSAASSFITDGVVPGMYVNITAPTNMVGRYKIGAVNSQTKITLSTGAPLAATGITFFIDKDLTKNEQASVMAAYAHSLGSRRLVMTWPDVVKLPVGNVIKQLPGYFLNAALGALTTGLPTQQGLTNTAVSVFTGVVHSTKYFDRDQLNLMADGGVMIFVQDVLDQTALYIRHQLTTDRSAIKFQEYSITKNVDFIAKFIRTNHKQFIGKYNIVDNAFDDLKSNAKGLLTFLVEKTKFPKIGGVIKSGKLTKIEQDPVEIDAINEIYNLDIPVPLNKLNITIVV